MAVFTAAEQLTADDLITDLFEPVLGTLQNIQVNGEKGVPNVGRNILTFNYNPMIVDRSIRPQFEHNREDDSLLETTDYTIDLTNGQITLVSGGKLSAGTLPVGDEILGFYKFKYFLNTDLSAFLKLALANLNARKPATAFSLDSTPLEWDAPLILRAYMYCLERILSDTTLWKSSIIFADPSAVQNQLQGKLTLAATEFDFLAKVNQRRGWAAPKAVTSRRLATQQRVTAFNWQSFTIGVG